MGQHISKACVPLRISFRECLVDGRIDVAKYMVHSQSVFDEDSNELEDMLNVNNKKRNHDNNVTASNKKGTEEKVN